MRQHPCPATGDSRFEHSHLGSPPRRPAARSWLPACSTVADVRGQDSTALFGSPDCHLGPPLPKFPHHRGQALLGALPHHRTGINTANLKAASAAAMPTDRGIDRERPVWRRAWVAPHRKWKMAYGNRETIARLTSRWTIGADSGKRRTASRHSRSDSKNSSPRPECCDSYHSRADWISPSARDRRTNRRIMTPGGFVRIDAFDCVTHGPLGRQTRW